MYNMNDNRAWLKNLQYESFGVVRITETRSTMEEGVCEDIFYIDGMRIKGLQGFEKWWIVVSIWGKRVCTAPGRICDAIY